MNAMIFAAGLGTRLRPLTEHKPKALVSLMGKTLLQHTIEKLIRAGVRKIVINIHHFAPLMVQCISRLQYPQVELLLSNETELLLDTGGGLLKARDMLQDGNPLIVHNVDVISDIDLQQMYALHQQNQALATLAVSPRSTARYFLFDHNRLCGWENTKTGEQILCYKPDVAPRQLAFSGIHILSPEIFNLITETGVFSINQVYLRLAAQYPIQAFEHNPHTWADLGSHEKIKQAEAMLALNPHLLENT